jgi:hypothetical protein
VSSPSSLRLRASSISMTCACQRPDKEECPAVAEDSAGEGCKLGGQCGKEREPPPRTP